jgi:hypothetical protein
MIRIKADVNFAVVDVIEKIPLFFPHPDKNW